jgi:excisionase family DNA binding protein
MPSPNLINAEAAAEQLSISIHSLRRWARKRRVPSVRIGRTLRFSQEALDQFIEANAVEVREELAVRVNEGFESVGSILPHVLQEISDTAHAVARQAD